VHELREHQRLLLEKGHACTAAAHAIIQAYRSHAEGINLPSMAQIVCESAQFQPCDQRLAGLLFYP